LTDQLSISSVRLSNSRTKRRRKTKIGVNIPPGRSTTCADYSNQKVTQRSRSPDVKHLRKITRLLTAGGSCAGGVRAHCTLSVVHVKRRTTLGNYTDGRIHVGIRRTDVYACSLLLRRWHMLRSIGIVNSCLPEAEAGDHDREYHKHW